jgi:CheY-like chemotaxis protein
MRPSPVLPSLLLIENNPDLRTLETLILSDAGFQVETPPAGTAPVDYAAQSHPRVIVVHLEPDRAIRADLLDRLQANPATRLIPVVAIARSEGTAAAAQAGANVTRAIVAPYDVTALQAAAVAALGSPPPAATLPHAGPAPSGPPVAATALVDHSREIVLRAIEHLRQFDPYRSRFAELSTGLVNALGTLLGAIATGWQRGLPPAEVFATPAVQRSIAEHRRLREQQGLGLPTIRLEVYALRDQVRAFLTGLAGHAGLTAAQAAAAADDLQPYFDALDQILINQSPPPNGAPPAP